MFPDDAAAEAWMAEVRWPDGPVCPRDGCDSTNVQHPTTHPEMPYRCRTCRKFFSVKTGTAMQGSNLGAQTWALAVYLLTTGIKGTSSMKLHRDLGISQKSAWHLAHRIRQTWTDSPGVFEGPVEVDETAIGGKRKNMHAKKRKTLTGRGSTGKAIVVGMKDRKTGKVDAEVVSETDGPTLRRFVIARTSFPTMVYSDDNPAYKGLPFHETVKHTVGEYVRDQAHANGIESFWSLMKKGYLGDVPQDERPALATVRGRILRSPQRASA